MTVHLLIPASASLPACVDGWINERALGPTDGCVCENREDIHLTTSESPSGDRGIVLMAQNSLRCLCKIWARSSEVAGRVTLLRLWRTRSIWGANVPRPLIPPALLSLHLSLSHQKHSPPVRYYLMVKSKEPRLCEPLFFTERETRNLRQGHPCAALSVRIAVVASALISIFKWTQFLFESEHKVPGMKKFLKWVRSTFDVCSHTFRP